MNKLAQHNFYSRYKLRYTLQPMLTANHIDKAETTIESANQSCSIRITAIEQTERGVGLTVVA